MRRLTNATRDIPAWTLFVLMIPFLLLSACGGETRGAGEGVETSEAVSTDDHGDEDVHGDAHAHGEEGEASDLDLPVDALFAMACEHKVPTFQCSECRYEVGVAEVAQELIDDGVVKLGEVSETAGGAGIELTGEVGLDERKVAHLSPRVSGIVHRTLVGLGQTVSTGQVLVELESVELAEAEAGYLEALAERRLADRTHERQKGLREAKITSEREYLEAEQALETARIRSELARQRLVRFGMAEEEIATLEEIGIAGASGLLHVRAPFDGEVLELHAVRGERIEPGDEMALLGDTRSLWVWVDLYEDHLRVIGWRERQAGPAADVEVRAYPGEVFRGHIDFVGRLMDETTRTVKGRIAISNPDGKLKPGMFATVTLRMEAGGLRASVPAPAVLSDEGRDFVFVHHHDRYFVRRPVVKGRETRERVEILHGLEPGQSVVVAGAFLLKSDVLRSKMGAGCAD